MFDINKLSHDERFALLYGIMLGDGCLSKYVTKQKRTIFGISIVCNYYDDIPFIKEFVAPIINSLRSGMKPLRIIRRPEKGTVELFFSDKSLFCKINSLGFPIGKKGTKIIIPGEFHRRDLVKYVIQGIFATDGSLVLTKNPNKFYPRLEVHMIAHDLIRQIHEFLIENGFNGNMYECKRNKDERGFIKIFKKFRVQFNGKKNLILFYKNIGFVNPKQLKKFQAFMRYDRKYLSSKKELFNRVILKDMAALRFELRTSSS